MSEPVSQSVFFDQLNRLREEDIARHRGLREDIAFGFRDLGAKLDAHTQEDRDVADRVLTMETERAGEKAQAVKHATWAGIVAAAMMNGMFEVAKRVFGDPRP